MAKHVRIEPDCPKCGEEMTIVNKGLPPFTKGNPWGSKFEAWYRCSACEFETDHAIARHKDQAIKLAKEQAAEYLPKE